MCSIVYVRHVLVLYMIDCWYRVQCPPLILRHHLPVRVYSSNGDCVHVAGVLPVLPHVSQLIHWIYHHLRIARCV